MKRLSHSVKVNLLFALAEALLLAVLLLLNGIALKLSARYPLQVDLTSNARFEIGSETKELLAAVGAPVEIFVLSDEGGFAGSEYLAQAKRVIDQYPRYSSNVSLSYVDYSADPAFAVNYPELSLSHGDIIVQSAGKVKHVLAANLFHYTYTPEGSLAVTASRAEEALSSAIVSVVSGEAVRVAALGGNGVTETPIFTALLADNNYAVEPVSMSAGSLEGFAAALLLAPTIDISEDGIRKLEDFLYNGGAYGKTLLYAAGAAQGAMPNLDMFLAEWGISFSEGAVFETESGRTYQYQPFYPTAVYAQDKYAAMLRDSAMPFLMPLARPMRLEFTARDRYYVETPLTFAETSGARPANADESFSAETAEIKGPLPALAISSYNASGGTSQSKIVVSSSVGIFEAIALQNSSLTNAEYLLNLMADVTDKTDSINIQPKELAGKTLGVTSAQATALGVVLAGVVPGLILLAGVAAWLFRRHK